MRSFTPTTPPPGTSARSHLLGRPRLAESGGHAGGEPPGVAFAVDPRIEPVVRFARWPRRLVLSAALSVALCVALALPVALNLHTVNRLPWIVATSVGLAGAARIMFDAAPRTAERARPWAW